MPSRTPAPTLQTPPRSGWSTAKCGSLLPVLLHTVSASCPSLLLLSESISLIGINSIESRAYAIINTDSISHLGSDLSNCVPHLLLEFVLSLLNLLFERHSKESQFRE